MAESIRFVTCTTFELQQDAAFTGRVGCSKKSAMACASLSESLLHGDGVGKPLGLLNPKGGIPICDISAATPVGQCCWQDSIMLKYKIPMQW
jgi:hypothetical protein